MTGDLFENKVVGSKGINIYADEIQSCESSVLHERWMYTGAIYELIDKPFLQELINIRYRKNFSNWQNFIEKNDCDIHWSELKGDNNRKNIVNRWLNFILDDCQQGKRKFFFSIFGINLSNLNTDEFGDKYNFNNIYNRFFRSMIGSSIRKFFGTEYHVEHIYHEEGQQSNHNFFNWHTIFKLSKEENINFLCKEVEFLPKSHLSDERSNLIQLCDVLLGIFKDVHLGYNDQTYPDNKSEILNSKFTQEFLIQRIIRQPNNSRSSFGYHRRFNVSLFPNKKTRPDSLERIKNNFYDISKIELGIEYNPNQLKLGQNF